MKNRTCSLIYIYTILFFSVNKKKKRKKKKRKWEKAERVDLLFVFCSKRRKCDWTKHDCLRRELISNDLFIFFATFDLSSKCSIIKIAFWINWSTIKHLTELEFIQDEKPIALINKQIYLPPYRIILKKWKYYLERSMKDISTYDHRDVLLQ